MREPGCGASIGQEDGGGERSRDPENTGHDGRRASLDPPIAPVIVNAPATGCSALPKRRRPTTPTAFASRIASRPQMPRQFRWWPARAGVCYGQPGPHCHCRRRHHGCRLAIPSRGRGLPRSPADREGRADVGLDLARRRSMPQPCRQLQPRQDSRIQRLPVPQTGATDRSGRRLAWLRQPPLRLHRARPGLVPLPAGDRGQRRLPHGDRRRRRDREAESTDLHGRRAGRRLDPPRRSCRPVRALPGDGQGGARNGCQNRARQPRDRDQAAAGRRVGTGHGTRLRHCRNRGQRGRLLRPAGGADGGNRPSDLQYPAPLPGLRTGAGAGRQKRGTSGDPRSQRLRLPAPGAAVRPDRHLRGCARRSLATGGRAALGLRKRTVQRRSRTPDALARARHGAHAGVRTGRHPAHRQRGHLPQPRRAAAARPGGRTAQLLALLRLVLRHRPGCRQREVPGAVDVARRRRNQHDRIRPPALRRVRRCRLHAGQGSPGLRQDLRHGAAGGGTAGSPRLPDQSPVRQTEGPGLRIHRDLWLGAAQVVLRRTAARNNTAFATTTYSSWCATSA